MGSGAYRSCLPGSLVGRVQPWLAAKTASRTIDEFDVWHDVGVHVGDHRVYGTVVAVENGRVTMREMAMRRVQAWSMHCSQVTTRPDGWPSKPVALA